MAREKVFRFKQFSVLNDKSAMKVGTDGVLLGAWADVTGATKILDVGTGTGLIALMIAQRSGADITGIEIDRDAACEAEHNFAISAWKNRLKVVEMDFNEFTKGCNEKYDLIVSNPPYFVNSLECPEEKRMQARHTSSLNYTQLIEGATSILAENGNICLITPIEVEDLLNGIVVNAGLSICKKVYVSPVVGSAPKRILWHISNRCEECVKESFSIEKSRHVYTEEYIELTKEYYLKM